MQICWKCTHSQTIQNVDEFVPSHLQNLLTCSPIHPLQWMGAVRMRVQKADKNNNNCDVFIGCLDSHSDGTHSLNRMYWWASVVMLHFSKSVLMKQQIHLHLGQLFWVNYRFNHVVSVSVMWSGVREHIRLCKPAVLDSNNISSI